MLHNITVNNKIVVNLLICKYESPFLCFPKTVKSVSKPLKNKRIPIPIVYSHSINGVSSLLFTKNSLDEKLASKIPVKISITKTGINFIRQIAKITGMTAASPNKITIGSNTCKSKFVLDK